MNEREINELAAWTAKEIRNAVTEEGRAFDAAGEDIVREYVRTCLINWQRSGIATLEACSQPVTEIFQRRKHETQTELEVFNAMMIFGSKFPAFARNNQRERAEDAAKIAATLPAVKV